MERRVRGGGFQAAVHTGLGAALRRLAPRHGFEPRFRAAKAAVLPLDDRGMSECGTLSTKCSGSERCAATTLLQSASEAILGRCWARASNPLCGTLCRRWVRPPLASATPNQF